MEWSCGDEGGRRLELGEKVAYLEAQLESLRSLLREEREAVGDAEPHFPGCPLASPAFKRIADEVHQHGCKSLMRGSLVQGSVGGFPRGMGRSPPETGGGGEAGGSLALRLVEVDALCKAEMERLAAAAPLLAPLNQAASDWAVEAEIRSRPPDTPTEQ